MTRDHRMTARRVAAASLVLVLAGCASTTTPSVLSPSSSPSAATVVPSAPPSTSTPTSTATPTPSPTRRPEVSCVDRTLASMSEAQRIGQVFMIGLSRTSSMRPSEAAVADFHLGSFAFTTQSRAGVKAIRAITDAVQSLATKKATAGVGFFVAANQEGGLIQGLAVPASTSSRRRSTRGR